MRGCYTTNYSSPAGMITLASDGENLTGLWLEGQAYFCSTLWEEREEQEGLPVFHLVKNWLRRYFAGENPDASKVPLCPEGSAFRQRIWQMLREIPYGEVTTYGELARKAAREMGRESMSAQAVGNAVGHNPISILIPCHRVVGSNGSLTGYAGGIETKVKLLMLEGVDMAPLFLPKEGKSR